MHRLRAVGCCLVVGLSAATWLGFAQPACAEFILAAEDLVQADGDDLAVIGYSVPSFVDWDNDGLNDLVVGEGSGVAPAKVRVYINEGTEGSPAFSGFFYVKGDGVEIELQGSSCLGLFPRVVYWDADDRKDLLIGQSDGKLRLYTNTGSDELPEFDGGRFLQIGPQFERIDIDVGYRATPMIVDYNNDGAKDLVVGDIYGALHLYINEGEDDEPRFLVSGTILGNGTSLIVPGGRASPFICDIDGDGRKDLLTGNTQGHLLLYLNTGTDEAPVFSTYTFLHAGGRLIDYPGYARTRPFVCDWTGDGRLDVLMGTSDGRLHLCQGTCSPSDFDEDGDVDLEDFALLSHCLLGPGGLLPEACRLTDLDMDRQTTLTDLAQWMNRFSGPAE